MAGRGIVLPGGRPVDHRQGLIGLALVGEADRVGDRRQGQVGRRGRPVAARRQGAEGAADLGYDPGGIDVSDDHDLQRALAAA